MRHTENLNLVLFDNTDKLRTTPSSDSINKSMEIIDEEIKDVKNAKHAHSNKIVLDGITSEKVTEWNNKSTFSGDYNDLSNKPTIPTQVTDTHINSLIDAKISELPSGGTSSSSEYPKRISYYKWENNYDIVNVTAIDYETGYLTVDDITPFDTELSTAKRMFINLHIEGIQTRFLYGMMPKELYAVSVFFGVKVSDNQIQLYNGTTAITSYTESTSIDLTRFSLSVEKTRYNRINGFGVSNLDSTHKYKLIYYIPYEAHHCSGIDMGSNEGKSYGDGYGNGYASSIVEMSPVNAAAGIYAYSLNGYEMVSGRGKPYMYSDALFTKTPKYYEAVITPINETVSLVEAKITYFTFGSSTPSNNSKPNALTAIGNVYLQKPFKTCGFGTGNNSYLVDGASCEVWDYGEVK